MKYSHPGRPRYGTARSDAPANARDATSGPSSRQLRCERPAFGTQRYDAYAPAIRAHEIEGSSHNGGGDAQTPIDEKDEVVIGEGAAMMKHALLNGGGELGVGGGVVEGGGGRAGKKGCVVM